MTSTVATVRYGHVEIRYEVEHRSTRRTLAIEVHPDGRVLVLAPTECADAVIAERVHRRARWITQRLDEFERYRPRTPPRQYVSGESHLYLGRQYRLSLVHGDRPGVRVWRGRFFVTLPPEAGPDRVKALLWRWYLDRARIVFDEVLTANLQRFGDREHPRLIVRAMKTRWGSLSSAGTMTLNVQLVRAPRSCIEYVVVHELCHAEHRNHDAEFYALLGRMMPDWERRKERLEAFLL